jgi:hypothetical protein
MEELWSSLSLNLKRDYVITAACYHEFNGLQSGFGFVVKSFVKFKKSNGEVVRLLKVFSPWKKTDSSKIEWTGKYSKGDKNWDDDSKSKAGFAKLKDGEFFIELS